MSRSDRLETVLDRRSLDRPSRSVPSVDRAWDDVEDHARRLTASHGDRAVHRAYHSLYEDMLN
jgi:hypothetical protein